ncbi:oligopeptide ABC transporter ATP-binding protein [Bordetella ansorpii]|uniref:Oligopeptide ABC transporter ATP-binding protein n=1 Tax=Bordetella ansorpii TaxID=288768 RepID=A0A157SKN3_9BORD|nr:dipeptide ABC transporter ATP-binding protein [Bordetella ansorpii]SAI71039.1 oligopeptide ABC transporter ATP-binding protein [Bordetella ansorpii]
MESSSALLDVQDLKKHYKVAGRHGAQVLRAVDGISLRVPRAETLSLVGESGCGKSTTGKCLVRLTEPTAGRIMLDGQDLAAMDARTLRQSRQRMQFVFQDPYSSMNPRMRVRQIIGEPLRNFGHSRADIDRRVAELLERVSLRPDSSSKYPHEFSGGQRQRIVIARALALNPSLIVCDEPVSALDVSVQAQVVNLLMDLQRDLGLTYVFISHDLSVVRHVSHQVAVMYLGRIVEQASARQLFKAPAHPYTRALLAAVPSARSGERGTPVRLLKGEIPSPLSPPSGCAFRTRCPMAQPRCADEIPQTRPLADGHTVACHFAHA